MGRLVFKSIFSPKPQKPRLVWRLQGRARFTPALLLNNLAGLVCIRLQPGYCHGHGHYGVNDLLSFEEQDDFLKVRRNEQWTRPYAFESY